jgi:hypothetical protein
MEKLGAKPEEFLAMVVKNELSDTPHPLLAHLQSFPADAPPDAEQWAEILRMVEKTTDLYADVPLDERVNAAKNLMPFLYPRIQSVELTADVEVTTPGLNLKLSKPPIDVTPEKRLK